jgi:hypothetical protein
MRVRQKWYGGQLVHFANRYELERKGGVYSVLLTEEEFSLRAQAVNSQNATTLDTTRGQ